MSTTKPQKEIEMSHPRKKGGQRKDKKNERMREDVGFRKAMQHDEKPSTDQHDVVDYKSGSHNDANRRHIGG
jgi:hypothetical protein